MNELENVEPPRREERLQACIAYGGSICGLAGKSKMSCLVDGNRSFSQGSICLLLPALGMMNSVPDSVVLLHGAVGCGASIHGGTAGVRSGGVVRRNLARDTLWLSTSLDESDVVGGGEKKLERAILESDRRYRPKLIWVVATCVPGIIGDDIDGVVSRIKSQVSARIVPVHCQGFKTKIWATAYDAVYHGIGRNLLDYREEPAPPLINAKGETEVRIRESRTVNLMNVSSMGRIDEIELERLLRAIGLTVNIYPVFTNPEDFQKVTRAALSISTCPTHDDYFLEFLKERYGIPYIIKHMPIGIENTDLWLREIARFFHLEKEAERLIETERKELDTALAPFRVFFANKKAFVSAGEFRALATANLLSELGFEIAGIRSFHHDKYAQVEYEKLAGRGKDFPVGIANIQPFEEANMLVRLKPDLFLGHLSGNSTAAKLGIATQPIYNVSLAYCGYRGAFEIARRIKKQLLNTSFNKNLSRFLKLPYRESWYSLNPFTHIITSQTDESESLLKVKVNG